MRTPQGIMLWGHVEGVDISSYPPYRNRRCAFLRLHSLSRVGTIWIFL